MLRVTSSMRHINATSVAEDMYQTGNGTTLVRRHLNFSPTQHSTMIVPPSCQNQSSELLPLLIMHLKEKTVLSSVPFLRHSLCTSRSRAKGLRTTNRYTALRLYMSGPCGNKAVFSEYSRESGCEILYARRVPGQTACTAGLRCLCSGSLWEHRPLSPDRMGRNAEDSRCESGWNLR